MTEPFVVRPRAGAAAGSTLPVVRPGVHAAGTSTTAPVTGRLRQPFTPRPARTVQAPEAQRAQSPASRAPAGEALTGGALTGGALTGGAPAGGAPTDEAPTGEAPTGGAPTDEAPTGGAPTPGARLAATRPELAPLAAYLDDPAVTDVFINGDAGLFVDRGHGAVRQATWRAGEAQVRALAVTLVGLGGRHVDEATPCVDVRLDGGIRVHAALPPVARRGTTISIRVPRQRIITLDDLTRTGVVDARTRARLDELVQHRQNVLVTGAAGSGKTTLLGALLSTVPATERIVTIEDVAELRLEHPHHVSLQSRQPNLEGAGGIGLAQLVREALRMRPDRLVVGECRGAEIRELLGALNTGHDGGAGTLHANSLADVPARLEALGALAGLTDAALARQVTSAVDVVIHLHRSPDGTRGVAGMGRPALHRGTLTMQPLP